MHRAAFGLALMFLLPPTATAQPPLNLAGPGAQPEDPDQPPWIKLILSPATAPSPALKYRLLPELRDRLPGNAAVHYYRAFSPEWTMHRQPELSKPLDAWLENPRQTPGKNLSWARNYRPLEQIDYGARRDHCDWQLLERLRKEGFGLLIPDAQGMRTYASLLALRARLEMVDGKFDKAVYSLETGMALGRDMADGPTLIHGLIGIAFAQIMLEQAEELSQLAGSPNLYWALTDLPAPFISLRNPIQGERVVVDGLIPGIREIVNDPKARPLSVTDIQRFLDKLDEFRLARPNEIRLILAVTATRLYPQGKDYLLRHGWTAEQVAAMPVSQVALMYSLIDYDRFFDDYVKASSLPYWQARASMQKAERQLKEHAAQSHGMLSLAKIFLPAVDRVIAARARLDRRIAALRCIEAVRMHAAAEGKLPQSLTDIRDLPIPLDPATGKAFEYSVRDGTARLSAPAFSGPRPDEMLRYELTLRRSND
jgi:hypothetical protein